MPVAPGAAGQLLSADECLHHCVDRGRDPLQPWCLPFQLEQFLFQADRQLEPCGKREREAGGFLAGHLDLGAGELAQAREQRVSACSRLGRRLGLGIRERLHLGRVEAPTAGHLDDPEALPPLDDDVEPTVLEALQHLDDRRPGADAPHTRVVSLDETELELQLEALVDQLAVAGLEDVQRHELGGQQHHVEREQPDLLHAPKGTYDCGVDADAVEIRVLGCLIEKQRTTPDVYPLSLNSLRLACNQSTNRDPVVEYDEGVIRQALERLARRGWTRLASGAGSRAAKYRHLLDDALSLTPSEISLLAVLMLRGPQTPGELKGRVERLYPFSSLEEVDAGLGRLAERELVVRLERRPGQKEERWQQLVGAGEAPTPVVAPVAAAPIRTADDRVAALEERVELLERAVADLAARLA